MTNDQITITNDKNTIANHQVMVTTAFEIASIYSHEGPLAKESPFQKLERRGFKAC
jgi:hypothetical protein